MQTELFEVGSSASNFEGATVSRKNVLEKTFLTLRLDQTIGIVLVLLVFFVLDFSWGFEKGKHSVQTIQSAQIIRTAPSPVAPVLPENLTIVEEAPSFSERFESAPAATVTAGPVEASPETAVSKADKPAGKYTIQHVIYKTKPAAEREIQNLIKKGQKAFIIPSGQWLQVCVSGFETKKEADKSLRSLRSQRIISGDAYVRPIPA